MSKASDYDSAWKDALESYFPEFMALLWPDLHARIDWRHPVVFRDKELQSLLRSAKRGRRHVDKLVSVRLLDGQDSLLWIHVEIQAGHETGFAHRMYTYYIRLHEKDSGKQIISLAVLTDARENGDAKVDDDAQEHGAAQAHGHAWVHKQAQGDAAAHGQAARMSYQTRFWDCSLHFTFPVMHLESWRPRMDALLALAPTNPFAVVMLAQLDANATRPDRQRLVRKTELVKRLYHWGYQRDNVHMLLRIIDAMMALPEALEVAFENAIQKIEEETQMSYVTSIERVRLKRERAEGKVEGKAESFAALLSAQITRKFGILPEWAKVQLVAADDITLHRWAEQILDAQRIEDVFK